jgi:hypothetical protein
MYFYLRDFHEFFWSSNLLENWKNFWADYSTLIYIYNIGLQQISMYKEFFMIFEFIGTKINAPNHFWFTLLYRKTSSNKFLPTYVSVRTCTHLNCAIAKDFFIKIVVSANTRKLNSILKGSKFLKTLVCLAWWWCFIKKK